jgi:hypothetical protein
LVRASQSTQDRLKALKKLFLDDKLAVEQYRQGEKLLTTAADQLDDTDQKKRQVYADLAEGRLSVAYLKAALNNIETPQQREARLAREAAERAERLAREEAMRAEQAKQAKIASLLVTAKASQTKTLAGKGIAAVDEILELEPGHKEAAQLREKLRKLIGIGLTLTNKMGRDVVVRLTIEGRKDPVAYRVPVSDDARFELDFSGDRLRITSAEVQIGAGTEFQKLKVSTPSLATSGKREVLIEVTRRKVGTRNLLGETYPVYSDPELTMKNLGE